jgi:hypothetical protein
MRATIAADEARYQGHYYKSRRHTMQVNFEPYVAEVLKEIAAGAKRVKAPAAGVRAG